MIQVQVLTSPTCGECARAKQILEELKPQYPEMQVQEVDMATPEGQEMISKYMIMSSPGIIINGELFSTGALDKQKFIEKLNSMK
ncbi:MAG: hypothetical protein GXO71_05780 [Caldiserica bacterium]|nr:hypothetical protein [Caldisericota bacterium]